MKEKLDRFFKISERGSTVKTEIAAGLTTFFAMAYIVMVNPNSVTGDVFANLTGELRTIWLSVYVSSILVAVLGTVLYALYAKLPFAQACGMGLNSFFFVSFIVPQFTTGNFLEGYRQGLLIILLSGVIFIILSITGAREYIAKALPDCLKKSISAGIGLFIALIGFKNATIIQDNPYTFVQLFDFHGCIENSDHAIHSAGKFLDVMRGYSYLDVSTLSLVNVAGMASVIVAFLALIAIALLVYKKVKGAIIWAILGSTVLYYLLTWQLPTFDLGQIGESFSAFASEGLFGAFKGGSIFSGGLMAVLNAVVLVITFALVDMFDTIGTVYGTAAQAEMLDENGDPIDIDKAMVCDSTATLGGALLGTSTCTTFVESAAGVAAGGRTGLTSLVTAACFALCLVLSPIATIVPSCATAAALIYVGVLMLANFAKIDMKDVTSAVPAFLALIMMPLTYSISNGIAIGALSYVLIRIFSGKYTKKDIVVTVIAILFVLRFFLVSM